MIEMSQDFAELPQGEKEKIALWIQEAKKFLENPSLLISLANAAGQPLEKLQEKLPGALQKPVARASEKAIYKALEWALSTSKKTVEKQAENFLQQSQKNTLNIYTNTVLSAASGAVGGFFGPLMLLLELPVSTTLIMRTIAQNAQNFGFDPNQSDIKAECLFVFTLGSPRSAHDDQMNSSYLSSRIAFSQIMREIGTSLAEKAGASVFAKLVSKVATRFELAVSRKIVAQAIPIIGAAGGAAINIAFTDYFGRAAKYHFGLKALEDKYGKDYINGLYEKAH